MPSGIKYHHAMMANYQSSFIFISHIMEVPHAENKKSSDYQHAITSSSCNRAWTPADAESRWKLLKRTYPLAQKWWS
jgi:hypothetical protein